MKSCWWSQWEDVTVAVLCTYTHYCWKSPNIDVCGCRCHPNHLVLFMFLFFSCLELASLMFLFACWYVVIAVLYHTCCSWNTLNMCVCVCVCDSCPKKLLCFDFGFSFLRFLNCSLELAFLIFLFGWWYIVRSKNLYNFIFNPVISQFCSVLSWIVSMVNCRT